MQVASNFRPSKVSSPTGACIPYRPDWAVVTDISALTPKATKCYAGPSDDGGTGPQFTTDPENLKSTVIGKESLILEKRYTPTPEQRGLPTFSIWKNHTAVQKKSCGLRLAYLTESSRLKILTSTSACRNPLPVYS